MVAFLRVFKQYFTNNLIMCEKNSTSTTPVATPFGHALKSKNSILSTSSYGVVRGLYGKI